MNAAPLDTAGALQSLLDFVEGERRRQCERLQAEAQAEAAAIDEHSRGDALGRVRDAFALQRRRRDERLAAARARLATQRRLHAQQHTATLLELALAQLPEALRTLWADAGTRQAWVAATLASARQQLPAGPWVVQHAPGLGEAERVALECPDLQCIEDAALDAGLKVAAGDNLVDGTLAGLLAGRAEFEAQLLRALETKP